MSERKRFVGLLLLAILSIILLLVVRHSVDSNFINQL